MTWSDDLGLNNPTSGGTSSRESGIPPLNIVVPPSSQAQQAPVQPAQSAQPEVRAEQPEASADDVEKATQIDSMIMKLAAARSQVPVAPTLKHPVLNAILGLVANAIDPVAGAAFKAGTEARMSPAQAKYEEQLLQQKQAQVEFNRLQSGVTNLMATNPAALKGVDKRLIGYLITNIPGVEIDPMAKANAEQNKLDHREKLDAINDALSKVQDPQEYARLTKARWEMLFSEDERKVLGEPQANAFMKNELPPMDSVIKAYGAPGLKLWNEAKELGDPQHYYQGASSLLTVQKPASEITESQKEKARIDTLITRKVQEAKDAGEEIDGREAMRRLGGADQLSAERLYGKDNSPKGNPNQSVNAIAAIYRLLPKSERVNPDAAWQHAQRMYAQQVGGNAKAARENEDTKLRDFGTEMRVRLGALITGSGKVWDKMSKAEQDALKQKAKVDTIQEFDAAGQADAVPATARK